MLKERCVILDGYEREEGGERGRLKMKMKIGPLLKVPRSIDRAFLIWLVPE